MVTTQNIPSLFLCCSSGIPGGATSHGNVDDNAKRIFNHVDLDFLMEEAEREDAP